MPGDQNCLGSQSFAHEGDVYAELSRLTGFGQVGGAVIGSVCDNDYTSQLADIGQSVKDRKNSIALDCEPADIDNDGTPDVEIHFRENSSSAFSLFSASRSYQGTQVVFNDLLPPGEYQANYKCLK